MIRKLGFPILVLAMMGVVSLSAQYFGKNKVQYRVFDWSFIQSPRFDIYYYGGGTSLAEFTSEVAEEAYDQISKTLNWDLRKRVSIIIYNSHNDFQQTNVTYQYMPEGVGGVTELFKNRVVIPFEGSYEQFRHVIHHELVHAMINDMIYGGSAQSLIQNRIRVRIPLWMNEGLAEYLSTTWDTQADMIMRDVAINDRIPQVRELDFYMAYKGGQSVWRFISEKYGREKIGEIFAHAKAQQDVTVAFQKALGMDFEDLSKQWQKYLKKEYWPDVAGRDELEDIAHRMTDHEELKNYFNISPSISPDGSKIAIISDRSGYSDIYLISAIDGTEIKKLVKGNRTPEFEELKLLQPGLTWSPDSKQLAFSAKAGESDALYMVDVKTGEIEKQVFKLDGIFTAAWNPTREKIAFVGNKIDASDIYIFDLKTKEVENLTRDIFSDSEPSWSHDGRYLAFVSDRGHEREVSSDDFSMIDHNYGQTDIFILDTETGDIQRITDTPHNENYPVWAHTVNALAYTSDRNGVWNLYLHSLDQGESRAVSNVLTGIFQLSLSNDDQRLVFSGYSGTGWDIYSVTAPIKLESKEVSPTIFVQKREKGEEELASSLAEDDSKPLALEPDANLYARYIFAPEYAHHNKQLSDTTSGKPAKPLALGMYKNPDGTYQTHPYQTRFSLDLVSGQAGFSNVFGYTGATMFAFSDILGDHRVYLGTELVVNLENSDYFLWYEYLKHRNDYSFSLFHTAYFLRGYYSNDFIRLRHYSLDFSISRPFNRFQRMELGVTNHYINHRTFVQVGFDDFDVVDDISLSLPTYRLNLVYDTSTWGFTGPSDGWRASLQFMQSVSLSENDRIDFKTILLDGRRYFRLSRLYSFAIRLMGGTSFGDNPQKFLLGGVENWILGTGVTDSEPDRTRFNSDELDIFDSNNSDYLKNIYFSIFALPVRGSRYIERVGKSVLLTNFEFRFPFINYLALGFPLRIILGNIGGVLFIDLGAAWDDSFTHVFPFSGKNVFDDFIGGYGIGIRLNLGYSILRLDTAWDFLPGRKSSIPQYYLSLGTDL